MIKVFLLAILFTLINGEIEASKTITTSQQTTDGGYFTSLWTNGQGSVSMTLDGGSGYSLTWSSVGDFTAGKGWNPGSAKTISYTGSYTNSGGGCYGIYGWTKNPLVEYYICESVGQTGGPGQGENLGTFTSDGGTYTIWKHQQVNQPSISGTATFWQYISIRQGAKTSGTINIQNHFTAWANKGLNLGTHDYQIFLTECWSGSGSATCSLSAGGPSPPNPPPPSNPPPSNPPPSNPPPSNPPPSGGTTCTVYNGGSSLTSPFNDWSYGGSISYSSASAVLPITSSWNALYARHSAGFTLGSSSSVTFNAKGGSGSGNQIIQIFAPGSGGSQVGSAVQVSLVPDVVKSYEVTASQLGIVGTKVYGIVFQAFSSSVVKPSVSFTKIQITNTNCGQAASNTLDATADSVTLNNPGMIIGIVAAICIVIIVVVIAIVIKIKRSRREEIV